MDGRGKFFSAFSSSGVQNFCCPASKAMSLNPFDFAEFSEHFYVN